MFWIGLLTASYFITLMTIAWKSKRKLNSEEVFFASRKMTSSSVCFSMSATEISTVTFVGIPQAAFASDWNALFLCVGFLLGKITISFTILPLYLKLKIASVYEFIGETYGPSTQKLTATLFMTGRVLGSGVRLFLAAYALSVFFSFSTSLMIPLLTLTVTLYTLTGGLRSVIQTDTFQWWVFMGSAWILLLYIFFQTPFDLNDLYQWLHHHQKLNWTSGHPLWSWDRKDALITGFIGSFLLTLASHGTDQDVIQRLLATRTRSAQKALIGSGILNFVVWITFLMIGSYLAYRYDGQTIDSSRVFLTYIRTELPLALQSLLIVGLFAAAMSSLDSTLWALTTNLIVDLKWNLKQKKRGVYLIAIATALSAEIVHQIFIWSKSKEILHLGISMITVVYAGLLSLFLFAFQKRKGNEQIGKVGLLLGIFSALILFLLSEFTNLFSLSWYVWYPGSFIFSYGMMRLLEKMNEKQTRQIKL